MPENSTVNIFQSVPAPESQHESFDLDKLTTAFKNKNESDWTIPEAYLCILICAAMSDGVVGPEEVSEIKTISARSTTFKSLSRSDLTLANQVVNDRVATRPNALESACKALPADMRLPVFAHCVDIVLADGSLLAIEADFLNRILPYLDVPPDEAKRVMEVLLIKNRY